MDKSDIKEEHWYAIVDQTVYGQERFGSFLFVKSKSGNASFPYLCLYKPPESYWKWGNFGFRDLKLKEVTNVDDIAMLALSTIGATE